LAQNIADADDYEEQQRLDFEEQLAEVFHSVRRRLKE